ncbi:MAG: hypothetical protein JWM49_2158 [Microbacteriaceae bacterium]|jgi:predicted metalloprotease|nr:hypothetical protein [Microbacteriaceae bacterium]
MTKTPPRLSALLLSCVVLGGCSSTADTPGAGGRPSSSTRATEKPTPSATDQPIPSASPVPTPQATGEPLDKTKPLPAGPEASSGEVLNSDLTTTNAASMMDDFLNYVLQDVDSYWTGVWAAAGYPEPSVNYAFPAPGEQVEVSTGCTPDESGLTNDSTAEYCASDDTIVISQTLATGIWDGTIRANMSANDRYSTGDFSVAYVVAHEYAHSLQSELNLLDAFETYKTELHADCWAGIWANSAYYEGILEAGDIEEAFQTTLDVGDYEFNDPEHHGTPQQRSSAFMAGYNSGVPASCDTFLTSNY